MRRVHLWARDRNTFTFRAILKYATLKMKEIYFETSENTRWSTTAHLPINLWSWSSYIQQPDLMLTVEGKNFWNSVVRESVLIQCVCGSLKSDIFYSNIIQVLVVLPCILIWNMKWFTNLMQLSIYLCSFSSTCFGLTRPSSGAKDVTVSLHMQHMVPWCGEVSILRSVCAGGVLHFSARWACKPETCRAENTQ